MSYLFSICRTRLTVQECLEHPWLRGDSHASDDRIPSSKYTAARDKVRSRYVRLHGQFAFELALTLQRDKSHDHSVNSTSSPFNEAIRAAIFDAFDFEPVQLLALPVSPHDQRRRVYLVEMAFFVGLSIADVVEQLISF